MIALDILTRAARSLKNAKARTALTSLAIAVGAFTLTLTLAAGNGIRAYTDRLISSNFDPAESIVGRDKEIENTGAPNSAPQEYDESVTSMSVGGSGDSVQLKQITDTDVEALKKYDFIETVRPNYQINARYITRDDTKKYTLSVQAFNPGQKPELVAGTLPANDVKAGELLLPQDYLSLLGFKDATSAIGQTVQIATQKPFTPEALREAFTASLISGEALDTSDQLNLTAYTVSGVTKKGVAALTPAGLPVLLSAGDAKQLYDYTTKDTTSYGKYLYALVRVKGGADDAVAADAKKQLKADGFYVMTSQDLQKTIRQFVDVLQILVAVFGVITVIASVFGIINTMYISVLERTREIGLMKALGMSRSNVAWLFRIEAAWIGLMGGGLGALSAWALGTALNPTLTDKLGLGEGNRILMFDAVQITILIAVLTLVATLAGWLPARKAGKLDPIVALRTE